MLQYSVVAIFSSKIFMIIPKGLSCQLIKALMVHLLKVHQIKTPLVQYCTFEEGMK